MVDSCGGTDSGTNASPLSCPVFHFLWMLWMNAAWKATGQLLALNGLTSVSRELLLLLLLLRILLFRSSLVRLRPYQRTLSAPLICGPELQTGMSLFAYIYDDRRIAGIIVEVITLISLWYCLCYLDNTFLLFLGWNLTAMVHFLCVTFPCLFLSYITHNFFRWWDNNYYLYFN